MARITFDQIKKFSGGGGSFFNLKNGEEAMVRILFNNYDDIVPYVVHEFSGPNVKNYATIDCGRQEGQPMDACRWCSQGHQPVVRVVVPLYNVETGEIQYWKKSGTWVDKEMKPMTDEVLKQGAKIAGQVYKIKRQGDKLDTKYTLIPIGGADLKTKDDFGIVKSPFELNIIKPADFAYDPNASTGDNTQGANGEPVATRRTADIF